MKRIDEMKTALQIILEIESIQKVISKKEAYLNTLQRESGDLELIKIQCDSLKNRIKTLSGQVEDLKLVLGELKQTMK